MLQGLGELLLYQLPPSKIKIATAINDHELEARVVATALKNNWQLIKRAVDVNEIELIDINYLFISGTNYSPNFNGQTIHLTGSENSEEISKLINKPINSPIKELNLMPGIGKNLALIGIAGGVGTTTLAINLAFELAERNFEIHLVDFIKEIPMVAPYLGLRDLMRSPNHLLKNLLLSEVNYNDFENYKEFLQNQINRGVNTIFDLGTSNKSPLPTTNIYVARMDLSCYTRLNHLLTKNEIPENSWLLINMRTESNFHKKLEKQFLKLLESSPFKRVRTLPDDSKALMLAQNSLTALIESAKGSSFRRSIRELAKEII